MPCTLRQNRRMAESVAVFVVKGDAPMRRTRFGIQQPLIAPLPQGARRPSLRAWWVCRTLVIVLTLVMTFGLAHADDAAAKSTAPKSPLSPEESLKHFVLADSNLLIEIVAAEPEVIDPVSIQFDEHGRLWVVEMRDYPTGPKEAPPPLGGSDAKPLSRIKLLEDKDGDGRFETSHVFADNLLFATGVQP